MPLHSKRELRLLTEFKAASQITLIKKVSPGLYGGGGGEWRGSNAITASLKMEYGSQERDKIAGFEDAKKKKKKEGGGHKPRNMGSFQKLERARKWTLP